MHVLSLCSLHHFSLLGILPFPRRVLSISNVPSLYSFFHCPSAHIRNISLRYCAQNPITVYLTSVLESSIWPDIFVYLDITSHFLLMSYIADVLVFYAICDCTSFGELKSPGSLLLLFFRKVYLLGMVVTGDLFGMADGYTSTRSRAAYSVRPHYRHLSSLHRFLWPFADVSRSKLSGINTVEVHLRILFLVAIIISRLRFISYFL